MFFQKSPNNTLAFFFCFSKAEYTKFPNFSILYFLSISSQTNKFPFLIYFQANFESKMRIYLFPEFSLLIFFLAINFAFSTFSPNFSAFLVQRFGKDVEVDLARRDLGPGGSFGGGHQHSAGQRTQRRPILMVHGLSTIAGEYENLRQYFLLNGYSDAEVYASTYAHGKLNWTKDSMECSHVKRFRLMLMAISEYADSQVDVIGYSMGSPIGRKAILGGRCVDGAEDLGPALTHLVHSFIGVAGANRDAVYLCKVFNGNGPCNNLTGISCHSRFLDDLNYGNPDRFEASKKIYTIFTLADEIVGYRDCQGILVSPIHGQDYGIKLIAHTHFTAIFLTFKEQLDLLSGQYEPKFNVTINWGQF